MLKRANLIRLRVQGWIKEKLGKKSKGNGFVDFVLLICIGAAIYLIVSGKGEALINQLWTWANGKIATIIK